MINNLEERDQNQYLTSALFERELTCEVTGEFVLPDYQCEIRRILRVEATPLPPTKYVGSAEVEFSGNVDFHVTYVGGDGELYCIPLSQTYGFSAPIESGEGSEGVTLLCSLRPDGINTRVSAPRKLSLRCRLCALTRVLDKRAVTSVIIGEDSSDNVFRRTERALRLECESSLSQIVPVECVFPPLTDDTRIVCADAAAIVSNCAYAQNGARCQGKVCVKLLCVSDGGEFSVRSKESPFETEHDISLDGASLRATATVCDMTVNVGDEGIECAMGVVSELVGCVNIPQEYTADGYSSKYECSCAMASLPIRKALLCACGNATMSERVAMADTPIPSEAELIDASGKAHMQSCEWQNGKYVFSGNADVSIIWRKDLEFGAHELHIPIKYEHPCGEGNEVKCFDACARLDGLRCRSDGENLCVDAELIVSADCFGEDTVEFVERLELGERLEKAGGATLTVCYPEPDDTSWSIAKRYRVSPADITGAVGSDRFVFVE